jgi:hypothetical protein
MMAQKEKFNIKIWLGFLRLLVVFIFRSILENIKLPAMILHLNSITMRAETAADEDEVKVLTIEKL